MASLYDLDKVNRNFMQQIPYFEKITVVELAKKKVHQLL
jgi:hypothetical protein